MRGQFNTTGNPQLSDSQIEQLMARAFPAPRKRRSTTSRRPNRAQDEASDADEAGEGARKPAPTKEASKRKARQAVDQAVAEAVEAPVADEQDGPVAEDEIAVVLETESSDEGPLAAEDELFAEEIGAGEDEAMAADESDQPQEEESSIDDPAQMDEEPEAKESAGASEVEDAAVAAMEQLFDDEAPFDDDAPGDEAPEDDPAVDLEAEDRGDVDVADEQDEAAAAVEALFAEAEVASALGEVFGDPEMDEGHDDDEGALAAEVADVLDALAEGRPVVDMTTGAHEIAPGEGSQDAGLPTDGGVWADLRNCAQQVSELVQEMRRPSTEEAIDDLRRELLSNNAGVKATGRDVNRLQSDFQAIRRDFDALDRTVARLEERVENLVDREPGVDTGTRNEGSAATWVSTGVLGASVLLLSWALVFYLQSGNLKLALGAVVVANLVTCGALLWARRRSAPTIW